MLPFDVRVNKLLEHVRVQVILEHPRLLGQLEPLSECGLDRPPHPLQVVSVHKREFLMHKALDLVQPDVLVAVFLQP